MSRALGIAAVSLLTACAATSPPPNAPGAAPPTDAARACAAARAALAKTTQATTADQLDPIARDTAAALHAGSSDPGLASCRAALGHDLLEQAEVRHKDGVTRDAAAELAAAQRLYQLYVDGFPLAVDAKAWFYRGELAYTRAEKTGDTSLFREAADAYGRALAAGLAPELRKETAYAAFLALAKASGLASPSDHASAETTRPYTADEAAVLAAGARYLALDRDREPAVVFALGRIASQAGHWDDAIASFRDLVDRALAGRLPASADEPAAYAAIFLFEALIRSGRNAEITALYDRLRAHPDFVAKSTEFAGVVASVGVQLDRLEAERLAQIRDFRGCAEAYAKILHDHPDATDGEEIAYDEGVCWREAGDDAQAKHAFRDVGRRAPGSELAQKAQGWIDGH